MNAQLLCRARPGVTLTFVVRDAAVLGRDPGLEVSLPAEGVSRRHARISFDGKVHWIEDLKSTNGTFLNGQAVGRDRLRHLDVVTLGKELDLVFLVREAEAGPRMVKGIVRAALVPEAPDAAPIEIPPGEITLGRSAACNVVAESGAVSKVHARIERTRDQLVLGDLGSANGTFVNGARTGGTVLKDGDVVSLAGVEAFRLVVELGEVTTGSGRHSAALVAAASRRRFSADWKTRFQWSTDEMDELALLRQKLAARDQARQPKTGRTAPRPAVKPQAATPAQPAAKAPVPPAKAPTPNPPAPAKVVAPAPAAARKPPAPAEKPPVAKPPVVSPPGAKPQAPPPVVKPAPPAAPPAAAPQPARPIREVRLTGPGFDLVVTEPGAHDLGRSREARMRVDHPTVSRRHARIILSDDRTMVYLQDQGGANGTRLNGRDIEKLAPVAEGDVVGVGEVELKVSLVRE